ncbi:MAG: 4-oxalocrotonate tautomerase family protein [Agitococcus sp.]|jgi:4-oxalocrotonate tautomerase|nr:4-oxalocrotonate tautomerase family protein [Moraxellaceae bacterium]MBP9216486.1 4-oxalocrotonate tautomerase family protein [Agitococcus sp.]HQV81003.1 4-oxalocrotonate tautomerase family protein [Agitococcus sp.]
MPYVNIKITKEGATTAQKAELIAGVTDLLVRVLNKNPATTVVVIDEVDTDNWGISGQSVTTLRQLSTNK